MIALLILGALNSTPARAAATAHATAEIVADVSTIKAGEFFNVGILIHVEPGWHVYWKNPGDSGLPTSVTLTAPEGFVVGEVKYPTPTTFDLPSGKVFGYADEVMLIVSVLPPKELPAGKVTLSAAVDWLSCQVACVRGSAELAIDLPVGERSVADHADVFAGWRARLPAKADNPRVPAKVAVSQSVNVDPTQITLVVDWNESPTGVQWFPAADSAIELTLVSYKNQGKQTTIKYSARVLKGQHPKSTLIENVVRYSAANGDPRGIEVTVDAFSQ